MTSLQTMNTVQISGYNNLFSQGRASKDYKRSLQRQVSDEVLKKRELTQIIKHFLKTI